MNENEHITAYYDDETKKLVIKRGEGIEGRAPQLDDDSIAALPPVTDESFESSDLYVYVNDAVEGPFSLEQLTALVKMNTVNSATPCCEAGANDWKTVGDYMAAPEDEPARAT